MRVEDQYLPELYFKRPVVAVRGRGAIVWDADGREYIDCMAGFGVAILGHCHPRVVQAIAEQASKLITCHGSLYNDARAEFLEKLVKVAPSGLEKAVFVNTGAEAVECAIKMARKYTGKRGVIAAVGGFHGKTMGALSATWNKKYREPFEPLLPGFKHVPYGRAEEVEQAIDEETAAVIVEPIQGEAGVKIPPSDYLVRLREVCDEKGVLLILDEIQTGLGRTGKMFACQHWGVSPDIMCLAKGIAGGVPMGVVLAKAEVADSLKTGEHTSTFAGNALACAAASATLDMLIEEKLPERAWRLGEKALAKLREIAEQYRVVREARGLGLMMAIELRFDAYNVLMSCLDKGLLVAESGRTILRMLPPLTIPEDLLSRAISIIESSVAAEEDERIRGKPS